MRLSPTTGKALMGQGSGTISIDGLIPASLAAYAGGGWDWLGDDLCGGQAFLGGLWHLKQLVVSTDTLSDLDPLTSAGDVAQQFRAGNGEWARFVAGGGVHSSAGLGLTLPLAALGDMQADGKVAVVQNYAHDNGIVTYAANGSTLQTISTSVLAGTQRLRAKDDLVAYQETNLAWHLRDIATGALAQFAPRTDATVATMVPVKISGVVWVVELTGTDLTLRPATSSSGFVIATSGSLFFPDAVSMSAGTVRIGWSVTSGEARTSLRLADITVTSGAVTNGSSAGGGGIVLTPGTDLPGESFPVGPVEGGSLAATKQPKWAIKEDAFIGGGDGKRVYQHFWDQTVQQAFAPVNLSQATGTVPPANGGTGGTTGLTVLNGENILPGTIPCSALQTDCLASLKSGWIPLVDGSEPPVFITDGSGVLILVAGPS